MTTRYMATLKIQRLDGSREEIVTMVKATGLDDLKRKVSGVLDLMDDADDADVSDLGGTQVTR